MDCSSGCGCHVINYQFWILLAIFPMNSIQKLKAAILLLDAYNILVTALLLLSKIMTSQPITALELSIILSILIALFLRMFIDVKEG